MTKEVALTKFEEDVIMDRLEGWELVDFLQVPIQEVLTAALEFGWIDDDNRDDLVEFAGIRD